MFIIKEIINDKSSPKTNLKQVSLVVTDLSEIFKWCKEKHFIKEFRGTNVTSKEKVTRRKT